MLGLISPSSVIVDLSGGRKTCTTGGVREQITATETPISMVVFQALPSNTGNIAIGGADVVVAAGSEKGIVLVPSQTITIPSNDLRHFWLDSAQNGEGVTYLLLKG